MLKISVVIITLNEEKSLEKTIKAARKVSDDIIIVDSYSTDRTVDVAKFYGARVFQRKWDGYSKQKNFGNNQAKYDFVLSIDADELLSDELINSIQYLPEKSNFDAFRFKRITYLFNKPLGYGNYKDEKVVRLFNKNKISWNKSLIHEGLDLNGCKVSDLKGDLNHYNFNNVEDYIYKSNLYSTLHANQLFENNTNANFVKIYFAPILFFLLDYIIKLGFLDGFEGYFMAKQRANYVYLKNAKLALLYRTKKS